ncbi:MAG: asparaginase domain-containing protein, partial [Candidatus Hadarchaeales archaeon]
MAEYMGIIGRLLKAANVKIGDRVRVEKEGKIYEGILMPRTELGDPLHLVLKLPNGYNIGIRMTSKTKITLLERGTPPKLTIPKPDITPDPRKPSVTIIGTGGTIASRVDYRTGAVFPAFTPEEIYSAVPEVAEIANIRVIEACNVFSEHMTPE